ncbi:MAG: glycosyl hydrolase, partial [Weeksellaceae bacterium]|nr:glycosyl hydrolase [Weeksellaceae bacterium]
MGGVLNFDAGTGMIKGPIEYASPQYWELKKHAISECQRLNLSFGMHNCPGWSSSGGPWVTPEYSMLEITWSETFINGGSSLKIQLPMPYHRKNFYQDVCILAFPSLNGELPLKNLLAKATSNGNEINIEQLENDPEGITVIGNENGREIYLQFEFKKPYKMTSLSFFMKSTDHIEEIKLEASLDGIHFDKITILDQKNEYADNADKFSFRLIELKRQEMRYLRLATTQSQNFSMFRFSEAEHLPGWKVKANFVLGKTDVLSLYEVPQSSVIDPSAIINLTSQIDSEGNFVWNVPTGNWTILRLGYTTKGTINRAAPNGAEGLEIDKYSKDAMDMHFAAMMKQLIPTMLPHAKNGKIFLEIDSWEVGLQNWTPKFCEEFHKRAGYDLMNYLPILTGR